MTALLRDTVDTSGGCLRGAGDGGGESSALVLPDSVRVELDRGVPIFRTAEAVRRGDVALGCNHEPRWLVSDITL